jgi:hypothetical protein
MSQCVVELFPQGCLMKGQLNVGLDLAVLGSCDRSISNEPLQIEIEGFFTHTDKVVNPSSSKGLLTVRATIQNSCDWFLLLLGDRGSAHCDGCRRVCRFT